MTRLTKLLDIKMKPWYILEMALPRIKMLRTFLRSFTKTSETSVPVLKPKDGSRDVAPEIFRAVEFDFVNSRASAKIGICHTCAPDRIQFLSELRDLEDDRSCFMLGHDVEPLTGIPHYLTEAGQRELEAIEKDAWERGELTL